MHLLTANSRGDPNVGLYAFCNNKFCIIGAEAPAGIIGQIEKILGVPVYTTNICGTPYAGVFLAGNNSKLLIPDIVFESELKQLDKFGVSYELLPTKLTALGNNILCNDNGCIVNPEFSEADIKMISHALGLEPVKKALAELPNVGSLAALTSKAGLIHHDLNLREIRSVEKVLGLKLGTGTVNMGNPYIRSGIIANDNGFVIGSQSGGPEIVNADEALGFV